MDHMNKHEGNNRMQNEPGTPMQHMVVGNGMGSLSASEGNAEQTGLSNAIDQEVVNKGEE